MSEIAKQYTRSEYCQLILANRVRKWVQRRLFYLESDWVFAECLRQGAGVRREGPFNWISYPDGELGAWNVRLRRRTSDFRVFRQIVLLREYESVVRLLQHCDQAESVATIVDAGANIGLSAIYFARSFPTARVIAIEADDENHKASAVNIGRSEAGNVIPLRQALWNEDVALEVRSDFRDGREWSRRVARSASGQGSVRGVSVPTILEDHQLGSIDLLKIDIEGAEAVLFDQPSLVEQWLPAVRCLAIEIHEPRTYEVIVPQLRRRGFFVFDRGELTLAVQKERISPERLLDYFESEPGPRDFPIVG